jgi:hypothetical protein
MQITLVGATDLPELLPLVRAYCDFYQVTPSDRELLELTRALLADPQREGLQLLARDDAGRAVGFATIPTRARSGTTSCRSWAKTGRSLSLAAVVPSTTRTMDAS